MDFAQNIAGSPNRKQRAVPDNVTTQNTVKGVMGVEATVTQDLVKQGQGHCTTTDDIAMRLRKKKKRMNMSRRHEVSGIECSLHSSALREVQRRGNSHYVPTEAA